MLTVCVLMFGVLLPPHSSWVCWRQWSPADTHTGRSPLYWCTLHFYTATCDCWVLNTRSHLGTERHAWVLKWQHVSKSWYCLCCLYFVFVRLLSYQCRPCGTGPGCIHQSSRRYNPPEPAHTDRSHSRSVSHTPLLANPQMPCMDLQHKRTTKCIIMKSISHGFETLVF